MRFSAVYNVINYAASLVSGSEQWSFYGSKCGTEISCIICIIESRNHNVFGNFISKLFKSSDRSKSHSIVGAYKSIRQSHFTLCKFLDSKFSVVASKFSEIDSLRLDSQVVFTHDLEESFVSCFTLGIGERSGNIIDNLCAVFLMIWLTISSIALSLSIQML